MHLRGSRGIPLTVFLRKKTVRVKGFVIRIWKRTYHLKCVCVCVSPPFLSSLSLYGPNKRFVQTIQTKWTFSSHKWILENFVFTLGLATHLFLKSLKILGRRIEWRETKFPYRVVWGAVYSNTLSKKRRGRISSVRPISTRKRLDSVGAEVLRFLGTSTTKDLKKS